MFSKAYGFDVTHRQVDSNNNPEIWLINYLSTFVCDHDKDDTLLIIYYAGHGWSAPSADEQASPEYYLTE